MARQVQLRRGTAAQHTSFTGANGEVTIDTDDKRAVVHDGSTAGGIPQAKESEVIKQGKHTLWIPAAAMKPYTTNGPSGPTVVEISTNTQPMVLSLDFDASTQEFAYFSIRMPKSWNLGTVTFFPEWSHPSTSTNFGVVWGLDAVATSNDDPMGASYGTAQTSADTGGTTNDAYEGPESSAITIAGTPAAGDLVHFRIHRDPSNGSDTMAVDARLHGLTLIYTINAADDT